MLGSKRKVANVNQFLFCTLVSSAGYNAVRMECALWFIPWFI